MIAGPKASKMQTCPLFINWPTETTLAPVNSHFSGLIAFLLLYSASSNSNTSSDFMKDTFWRKKRKIMRRRGVTKIVQMFQVWSFGQFGGIIFCRENLLRSDEEENTFITFFSQWWHWPPRTMAHWLNLRWATCLKRRLVSRGLRMPSTSTTAHIILRPLSPIA